MKKIILILMSALCFVFVGQAFAVGGPQSITAIVSSVPAFPTTGGLLVMFESTQPLPTTYAAKVGVGPWPLFAKSSHVTANYKSHQTIIWELDITSIYPMAPLQLDTSCIKLGFKLQYYHKTRDGYYVQDYKAKRKTAYSHYKFSYTIVWDNATLYCNEKAWD